MLRATQKTWFRGQRGCFLFFKNRNVVVKENAHGDYSRRDLCLEKKKKNPYRGFLLLFGLIFFFAFVF